MVQKERIQKLNKQEINRKGSFIIYWMQASQRTEYNHALNYAIEKANKNNKALIVFFGLTGQFPEANERHYTFMLEGLQEVEKKLQKQNIKFIVKKGEPNKELVKIAAEAAVIIVDRGYLRIEKQWRRYVSGKIACPLEQVESNIIVPVETASSKEEYAAYTIRPKIDKQLDQFLVPLSPKKVTKPSLEYDFASLQISPISEIMSKLDIDKSVKSIDTIQGGTTEAKKQLEAFIETKLDKYDTNRNDPTLDYLSNMSPYLHFGQISPLYIALKIQETTSPGKESYLEELIIRRELSMNFVFYNTDYDVFEAILPNWAKLTLSEHEKDTREYVYSLEEFEKAHTHAPYWNAAQEEMLYTGKMHGYMRMYWGKKILEWTETPEQAHNITLKLNNKYEIDGRDPNGYTGVAWCFGKHDRAWKERKIYGKVRYMNANGLERKFAIEKYVKQVNEIKKNNQEKL
ncbi:MAG: deoxyribodipyrimidine photo-lyase [Asgard group archaeon]|nr:deoxyribodipyrimidine photo-lyase [Asgard group archaeon]